MGKDILITPKPAGNPRIEYSGSTASSIQTTVLSDGTVSYEGQNGILFQIADSATGTIWAVYNSSNQKIFEVTSSYKIIGGSPNTQAFLIDGTKVIIATGMTIPTYSSAPSGSAGQIYFNSANDILYYHNGTSWIDTRGTSGTSGTSGSSGTSGLSGSSGSSGNSAVAGGSGTSLIQNGGGLGQADWINPGQYATGLAWGWLYPQLP